MHKKEKGSLQIIKKNGKLSFAKIIYLKEFVLMGIM